MPYDPSSYQEWKRGAPTWHLWLICWPLALYIWIGLLIELLWWPFQRKEE